MAPRHKKREAHVRRALAAGRGRISPTGREVDPYPTPPGLRDIARAFAEESDRPVVPPTLDPALRDYSTLELRVIAKLRENGITVVGCDTCGHGKGTTSPLDAREEALANLLRRPTFSVGSAGVPPGQAITFREEPVLQPGGFPRGHGGGCRCGECRRARGENAR